MGSLAMSKEARPDGTFCSAQCRVPWPIRKKKKPMMRLARTWDRVGRKRFARHQARRIEPAVKWRRPAV